MSETDTHIHVQPRQIAGKNGGTLTPIHSGNAAELAKRRWAKYRQAAARRVTDEAQAIDPTATTAAEAWGLAVAKQYTTLLDSEKPRGDDLHRIGQAIGALPMAHEAQAEREQGPTNVLVVGDEVAAMIAERLMRLRDG